MKLHYFFVNEELESGKDVLIEDEALVHQWRTVFRFKSEQKIVLLDGSGYEWHAHIADFRKDSALLHVSSGELSNTAPTKVIYLFCALPKKDKFEWILEKGVELGISHFVPVVSERVEKKDVNMERSRKIIKEAAEQSHRAMLPELHEVVKLEDIFEKPIFADLIFIAFEPTGEKFDASKIAAEKFAVLIGPEGGWAPKELELFKEKKVVMYSLGNAILRTETAAVAAASLLLL